MDNDFILVLDLGGREAIEMARKLRNQHYYTEIMSRRADIELFRRKSPRGILIVGGDSCEDAGAFPRAVLALGIPVLALGGASRMMIESCGAASEGVLLENQASQITFQPCALFDQLSESDRYFVRVDGFALPEGFEPIATTIDGLTPAFADFERNLYGLQFYAESNDPDGAVILSNFAEKICGCTPKWNVEDYVEEEIRYIRERVGEASVLMAVSGGIDSSACAMLMRRAIGDRLKCVFVDNGLLRLGEADQVIDTFREDLGLDVESIDASDRFLVRLRGLTDPIEKHRVIRDEFLNVIREYTLEHPAYEFFVQGTIYSDLLIRGSSDEVYARQFDAGKLLEPVRMLFKDEVRKLGALMGLPEALIQRQPFPAPALAVRCQGEVTAEKIALLRKADAIFREEIQAAGQDKRLTQYFAVLNSDSTLGRRDDGFAYEYACVLRAVSEQSTTTYAVGRLPYDLLERVAERIIEEVPGINRVSYDLSPDARTAIEWQ